MEKHVDEKQITISLSKAVGVGFTIALVIIGTLGWYYGHESATNDRISKVEAKVDDVEDLKSQVSKYSEDIAALREGMTILLLDRGYDPTKVLGKKTP